MQEINSLIGDRIRKYRLRLSLTQEELAERAGLHHTYIGQLERGEKNATIESIGKVISGLGISYELLFEKLAVDNSGLYSTYATQCYELVDALPAKEQKAVLEIVKTILSYKRL